MALLVAILVMSTVASVASAEESQRSLPFPSEGDTPADILRNLKNLQGSWDRDRGDTTPDTPENPESGSGRPVPPFGGQRPIPAPLKNLVSVNEVLIQGRLQCVGNGYNNFDAPPEGHQLTFDVNTQGTGSLRVDGPYNLVSTGFWYKGISYDNTGKVMNAHLEGWGVFNNDPQYQGQFYLTIYPTGMVDLDVWVPKRGVVYNFRMDGPCEFAAVSLRSPDSPSPQVILIGNGAREYLDRYLLGSFLGSLRNLRNLAA